MKKLALIATVAVTALPLSANAAQEEREARWYDGATTANVTVENEMALAGSPFIPEKGETLTLNLANTDNKLFLDGSAAFIIEPNGNKYYANNGYDLTEGGLVYHIVDGEALYVTSPARTTYTFAADVQDEDLDGNADDVDFTMVATPH